MPQPGPANINVSVRVLSPGDNGAVTQTNTSQASAPPQGGASGEPPWIWTWTFTWCGTTTEISTLAGEGTDLNWAWNWLWAWDCENSGEPATPADTGGDTASPVEPGPAADPPAAEPPAAPASGLPASVTQSGSGTTGATVDLSVTPPSTLTEWLRLPWAPAVAELPALHVPVFSSPTSATWGTLASWPTPLVTPPIEVAVDVTIPRIVLSEPPSPAFPVALMPTSGGAVQIVIEVGAPILPSSTALGLTRPDQAPRLDAHAPRGADPQLRGTSVRASWTHPTVQRSQPTADASAGSMPRPARGPLPFNLPRPLQAGGSSASTGGSTPSLLVFGFATLIGFFVLAAPGLGRRIRLAQLPSPRSRSDSPLDRPG